MNSIGKQAADDSLLDAMLLALRMHAPAVFNATHEHFTVISKGNRERLPEEAQSGFDERHRVLAEKLVLLRKARPT